jgi:hypothetical protein
MNGELTKLSESRWRYATGRRVYYVRQVKAPNEDRGEPGRYRVDGGGELDYLITADSVEQVLFALGQEVPSLYHLDPAS